MNGFEPAIHSHRICELASDGRCTDVCLAALLHCSWKVRVEYGGLVSKAGSLGSLGAVGLVGFGMRQNHQSGAFTAQKIVHLSRAQPLKLLTHLLTHRSQR